MKIKKMAAFLGLVMGTLMWFSFTTSSALFSCKLTVTNNSSTYYMGADSYDGWAWLAPGATEIISTNCLCPENPPPYVPYVEAHGPSSESISYTVSGGGGASGTVQGGSYEFY